VEKHRFTRGNEPPDALNLKAKKKKGSIGRPSSPGTSAVDFLEKPKKSTRPARAHIGLVRGGVENISKENKGKPKPQGQHMSHKKQRDHARNAKKKKKKKANTRDKQQRRGEREWQVLEGNES